VKSGLIEAIHILKNVKGIAMVELSAEDVVRHRLVKSIIEAYAKADESAHARQEQQRPQPAALST
jgi:phosphate starvation-inducible PhoH-like protein